MYGLGRAIKRSLKLKILVYVFGIVVAMGIASVFLFHRTVANWSRKLYSRANCEVVETFPKKVLFVDYRKCGFFEHRKEKVVEEVLLDDVPVDDALEEMFDEIKKYLGSPHTWIKRLMVLNAAGEFLRAFRSVGFFEERRFGRWISPEVGAFSEPDPLELAWAERVRNIGWERHESIVFLEHRPCPEGYERVMVYRLPSSPAWSLDHPYDGFYIVVAERLDKAIEEACKGILRSTQGIIVVDSIGTVLYHPDPAWLHQKVWKFLPGFPLREPLPEEDLVLKTRGGSTYLMRVRRWEGGTVLGVYTDYRKDEVAFVMKTLWVHVAIFLGVFAIGAVALGWGLSRALGTISKLTEEAGAIGRGEWDRRVPVEGEDEVGRLADAFNRMAERLEGTLDELVRERTERERQEELGRFKGRMMAQVAHDLGKILNLLYMPARELASGELDARKKRALERVLTGVRLIRGMADDMEMMAQVEEGRVEVRRERFRLGELWREVDPFVSALAERARADGVSIRMESVPEDLPIVGDREKLVRVLVNLISNGTYAARHRGKEGEVVVRAWDRGEEVVLEVRDNGPGIPEEDLSRIFEPFYRGECGGGMGLGLSIVKGFVEAHGGRIEVESKPGEGSAFRVVLPKWTR